MGLLESVKWFMFLVLRIKKLQQKINVVEIGILSNEETTWGSKTLQCDKCGCKGEKPPTSLLPLPLM